MIGVGTFAAQRTHTITVSFRTNSFRDKGKAMDHAEVPAPSLITRDVFLDMIKGDRPARGCVKLINVYDELLDEVRSLQV